MSTAARWPSTTRSGTSAAPTARCSACTGRASGATALGSVVNGLIGRGFEIRGILESISTAVDPEPGTFAHCETIAPPWLTLWARRAAA